MNQAPEVKTRTEIRDGMRITWHQPIKMDDGVVLRADMFQPVEEGRYPVILTYGIYAKGLAYQEGYPMQWEKMVADHPEILEGSTNKYQNWEVTDPGAVGPPRVCRHAGGFPRRRLVAGLHGAQLAPGDRRPVPVHRMGGHPALEQRQGRHAGDLLLRDATSGAWPAMHPPHLTAIIPWEGQNDRYRDSGYHGGILSEFQKLWAKHQVVNIQYGRGERARKNPNTGESVAGPMTLSDEELAKNRVNAFEELKKHPLDDEWHR